MLGCSELARCETLQLDAGDGARVLRRGERRAPRAHLVAATSAATLHLQTRRGRTSCACCMMCSTLSRCGFVYWDGVSGHVSPAADVDLSPCKSLLAWALATWGLMGCRLYHHATYFLHDRWHNHAGGTQQQRQQQRRRRRRARPRADSLLPGRVALRHAGHCIPDVEAGAAAALLIIC